jgi:hypothetical protein
MAKASAAVNGRAQVEAEDVVEAAGYVATAESTPLVSGAVKDVMERAAKAAAEKTANGRFKRLNGEYRMLQAKFGSTRSFKAKVRITNQALALLAQMAEVSGKNHDSALKDWQDTQDGLIRDFMNRTLAEAVTKEEDGAE